MCPKHDPALVARVREAAVARLAPDPCKHILSPGERRAFLERYVESNRRVARTFRPDAEAYLTGAEHPVPEEWCPMTPFSAAEVADLLVALTTSPRGPSGENAPVAAVPVGGAVSAGPWCRAGIGEGVSMPTRCS